MSPLSSSEKDGRTIIQLPEHLEQNDWMAFRDRVHRQFIDRGITNVIIDCEQAPDLPSIAYGALIGLARDLRRIKGSFALVHVSTKIRTVLTRTRLDLSLPIHGTLTEIIRRPVTQSDP